MTDPPSSPLAPGRIDLRALDDPGDAGKAEQIIRSALARVDLTPRVAPWLAARSGPVLAAAAAVLVVAFGLLALAPRGKASPGASAILAEWIAASHVPTNGEILAAFQGYLP